MTTTNDRTAILAALQQLPADLSLPPPPLVCEVCERDHLDDPSMVIARWRDDWYCTDCLEEHLGHAEAEAEAHGERLPKTKFVVCPECDTVYPKPQKSTCPNCQYHVPAWKDWDPAHEIYPTHSQIQDIIVGLLESMASQGSFQDHDGALFSLVRDALVVLSTMEDNPFRSVYEE